MDNLANNKRIAKNTMFLYSRTLFSMLVSLFTSRIVLDALGETDYGIYNVVGGVVAMFTIISGSLSATVTRFITFELGNNNIGKLKKIFSTSIQIHILLAIIIFVFTESIGVWFLNNKMTIPEERMVAANWVLQCSILTFILNIISVPYNAAIIAHERMKIFAYIGILEVLLKLFAAVLLIFSLYDNLIFYAAALLLIAVIIRLIYGIYCNRHFEECTFHFVYDKKLIKEIANFAGWNFIGSSSAVLRDHGVNITINIFHGPAVNAARAISYQINIAINGFVSNFLTALNPQIIKSYAAKDYNFMFSLMQRGSRFSFYLLLLLSLPVLMETNYILNLWLKEVPEHTLNFVRLILLFSLMESLSSTLITAMLATGKIRNYQIVVGGLQLLNFPISYLLLKKGFFPEITIIVAIILSIFCLFTRLFMLRRMIGLSISDYLKHVIFRVLIVFIMSGIVPFFVLNILQETALRFILISCLCVIFSIIFIYFIGCSTKERIFIREKLSQLGVKITKT